MSYCTVAEYKKNILIKNGLIYDGTLDNAPFTGDILISGDRIRDIAPSVDCEDAAVINAAGRMVTPGFIDIHRHADLAVFREDFGCKELAQGITTVGMGVCGFSFAPYTEKSEGLYSYTFPIHGPSIDGARYPTMDSYVQALCRINPAVNIATLQGLGAIRLAVKGYEPSHFSDREISLAQEYVQQAIDCGLRGFSTGLMYLPEVYNTAEELMRILRPCRGKDLLYMPHMRYEASGLVEAVEESIAIARTNDMALSISHFKALGPDNWRITLERAIEKIENARETGMDITVDFYPYHGTATTLASILPASFMTEDFSTTLAKITIPETIDRLRRCFNNPDPKDEWIDPTFRWRNTLISGVSQPENEKYLGKTVHECAELGGYDDETPFLADILASENGNVTMVGLYMDPDDIARIAKLPYSMVISDALYNITDTPHPRAYGSFPRMIRHFVQETGMLTMQEAIHKMTELPAKRMKYKDRGVLKAGYFADILIFDPSNIHDHATFADPDQLSTGIEHIFVNGTQVWKDEKRVGKSGVCLHGPSVT